MAPGHSRSLYRTAAPRRRNPFPIMSNIQVEILLEIRIVDKAPTR
jgi:hypothetical protein